MDCKTKRISGRANWRSMATGFVPSTRPPTAKATKAKNRLVTPTNTSSNGRAGRQVRAAVPGDGGMASRGHGTAPLKSKEFGCACDSGAIVDDGCFAQCGDRRNARQRMVNNG